MHKKGGAGFGVEKVVSAAFILLVIAVIIWAVHGQMYGGSRNALEEFFDLEEISNIGEEVFTTDKNIDIDAAHAIADRFEDAIIDNRRNSDCLIELDLRGLDNEFIVEFKKTADGRRVFEVSKGNVAIQRGLRENVYFGIMGMFFKIKNFNKIELGNVGYNIEDWIIYKSSNGDIYFLDSFLNGIVQGEFFDNFKKKLCSSASDVVRSGTIVVSSIEEEDNFLNDYFESDLEFLGDNYFVKDVIVYLYSLDDRKIFANPLDKERIQRQINTFIEVLSNDLEEYNSGSLATNFRDNRECWRLNVNSYDTYTRQSTPLFSFGNSVGERLIYKEAEVILSNGRVLRLMLLVSRNNCLPANVIGELMVHGPEL